MNPRFVVLALFSLFLITTPGHAWAAHAKPLNLWPGKPPGSTEAVGEEKDETKPEERQVAGGRVTRLGGVSTPTLTLYPAANPTGAAIIVCPGGGYRILAMNLEGTEVCEWLNSIGVTAVLLKYRVPKRAGDDEHKLPLQDIQRAVSTVRQNAEQWKIDPRRVGVLGFSAGGNLCALASTHFNERAYDKIDAADDLSCRPDFTLLIYPAYLVKEKEVTQLSPSLVVTSNHPPCFIAMAADDPVKVENAFVYGAALKAAHVPVEAHIYDRGGHGFGMRPVKDVPATHWPDRALDWLNARGLLKPAEKTEAGN